MASRRKRTRTELASLDGSLDDLDSRIADLERRTRQELDRSERTLVKLRRGSPVHTLDMYVAGTQLFRLAKSLMGYDRTSRRAPWLWTPNQPANHRLSKP